GEQAQVLVPDSTTQELQPTSLVETQRPDDFTVDTELDQEALHSQKIDNKDETLGTDGLPVAQTVCRLCLGQTVCSHLGQTVCSHLGQTPHHLGQTLEDKSGDLLGADRLSLEQGTDPALPVLSPLQWVVWEMLQEAGSTGRTVSYRQLAREAKATIN